MDYVGEKGRTAAEYWVQESIALYTQAGIHKGTKDMLVILINDAHDIRLDAGINGLIVCLDALEDVTKNSPPVCLSWNFLVPWKKTLQPFGEYNLSGTPKIPRFKLPHRLSVHHSRNISPTNARLVNDCAGATPTYDRATAVESVVVYRCP
jgi:hypothetical protein